MDVLIKLVLIGLVIFIIGAAVVYQVFWKTEGVECELSLCDCKCYLKGQTPEKLEGKTCDTDCLAIKGTVGCIQVDATCQSSKEMGGLVGGLPNRASIYCVNHGGELDLRTEPDGGQYNVCVFDDETECEEWKFYKKQCEKGDFKPSDDIWEGKIISLSEGSEFDDYFEMLNFDKVGIKGYTHDVSQELEYLRDKEILIKVRGKIFENVNDFSGKRLLVEEILSEENY